MSTNPAVSTGSQNPPLEPSLPSIPLQGAADGKDVEETPWKRPWERRDCCSPCSRGEALPPGTPPSRAGSGGGGSTRRSLAEQIPNPGGDFSVLSPGLAFGVEFYQQQLSKINKGACACQCSRGRARDWQSGTINYSSAPLPACRLQERPWQRAGEPEGEGRRGTVEGRGNVVLDIGGIVPERVEAARMSLSLLGVRVCTRVCKRVTCRNPCFRDGGWDCSGVFPRNGANLLVEGLGRPGTPQLGAGGPHGGALELLWSSRMPLSCRGRSWEWEGRGFSQWELLVRVLCLPLSPPGGQGWDPTGWSLMAVPCQGPARSFWQRNEAVARWINPQDSPALPYF